MRDLNEFKNLSSLLLRVKIKNRYIISSVYNDEHDDTA